MHVNDKPLRGGAWVLFRVTREPLYGSPRPWDDAYSQALRDINNLMADWSLQQKTQDQVKQAVLTTGGDKDTVADHIFAVRTQIQHDDAFSDYEKDLDSGKLRAYLAKAQELANSPAGYQQWQQAKADLDGSLTNGTPPTDPTIAKAFTAEAQQVASVNLAHATQTLVKLGELRTQSQGILQSGGASLGSIAAIDTLRRSIRVPPPAPPEDALWRELAVVHRARTAMTAASPGSTTPGN